MQSKKILVTGAAGFIGSNIVNRMIGLGHNVFGIDNFRTGKRENIHPECLFTDCDITSYSSLRTVFVNIKPEIVIHIAGNASIVNSITNPQEDISVNTIGTMNVVDCCGYFGVEKLIYASSMTIYGNQPSPLSVDNTMPIPNTNYAISKYAGERYVMIAGENESVNLTTCALRMQNVYGPNQDLNNPYQGVLAIFLGKLMKNKPITIHGDGEQRRDFIYIDDIVDAYQMALETTKLDNKVIDVGSGRSTSMNQLAGELMSVTRSTITVSYEPSRPNEQRDTYCKVPDLLFPKISLQEGISKTYEWAKKIQTNGV